MGRPRKPLWPPGHRGFESPTLRVYLVRVGLHHLPAHNREIDDRSGVDLGVQDVFAGADEPLVVTKERRQGTPTGI